MCSDGRKGGVGGADYFRLSYQVVECYCGLLLEFDGVWIRLGEVEEVLEFQFQFSDFCSRSLADWRMGWL
jgi:hypothetical protein